MDSRKQKRLGPAPIASFERSFEDTTAVATNGLLTHGPAPHRVTLTITEASTETMEPDGGDGDFNNRPNVANFTTIDNNASSLKKQSHESERKPPLIKTNAPISSSIYEHVRSATLNTPQTPRIELSRASSSSYHEEDSRDSSPENVFEQVGTGTLQETLGVGFREEGALELRSSTEELYFMDPEAKREEQEKIQQQLQQARRSSPLIFKFDEHQTYLQQHQRKDSASSEVAALLCISGRTSRISSVGSQGSAVSRLSAISGVSRSPSPHRMLLETSFCGPKPLENVVDGSIISTVEPPTAEILEQVLLSRKHDPTQAVFAEGIKIESSPQKKKPSVAKTNTQTKQKPIDLNRPSRQTTAKVSTMRENRLAPKKSPGQIVVGTNPSGSEYIRINLKPDHMYEDKGVAPNERVVNAPGIGGRPVGQKKPISLSLGKNAGVDDKRLTPSSSPKLSRHTAVAKESTVSRSPSPANVSVSRKSSFCSLFKQKDSPDSPKDRVRSRSKSRDRCTPQSQNPTPNKQKSVLAIFKPKRPESKSKSSSPVDPDIGRQTPSSKTDTAMETMGSSRPSSRLRYYDTPTDGKGIHIPLHTPPEEKGARKLIQSMETETQSNSTSVPLPSTPNASTSTERKDISIPVVAGQLPEQNKLATDPPRPISPSDKTEKCRRIENLDAIHTLPQDIDDKERTWSLEVQRHSSQDSQETNMSENSMVNHCSVKPCARTVLEDVTESPIRENGVAAEVHRAPTGMVASAPNPQPFDEVHVKEKRRLLFATRLGSGSQEQIFSTQFSLSKTESLSSQLSEQNSLGDNSPLDNLHRKDSVLRKTEDSIVAQRTTTSHKTDTLRRLRSVDETRSPVLKSRSTSDEEKQPAPGVLIRKRESVKEESRKKSSCSASEEDDVMSHRHSRYLENFDVRKKFHENITTRKSIVTTSTKDDGFNVTEETPKEQCNSRELDTVEVEPKEKPEPKIKSPSPPMPAPQAKPLPLHHHLPSDRQSLASTDEPIESSESERDSEADPNRLRRHIPRRAVSAIEEHESTGLVSQDSFDDELPYIPTTLPEERSHGVSLIPMKERVHMELKTCPLDRPRSTTPLNPSHIEEYCGIITPDGTDADHRTPVRGEKLRISLPRRESTKEKSHKTKSPRRTSTSSGKSWFEFAEEGIRGTPAEISKSIVSAKMTEESIPTASSTPAAPLLPSGPASLPSNRKASGQWVDFENIPEKRKAPKKITTLPKDSVADSRTAGIVVQYNYVKPEECQCECHEVERESATMHKSIATVDLLQQQGEDMQPLLEPEAQENADRTDSSRDYSSHTDDELDATRATGNQSEEFPLRGTRNPRNQKFPDNLLP